ncbi:YjzD family protein [Bacillus tianshenii]|nr:YjzD family protein [Bacillus tianshenii]
MRYFWTFFWSFLLSQMVTYVVSSMQGGHFNIVVGTTAAVVFTLVVAVVGDGVLSEEA